MKNENPLNYVFIDDEKPVNYRELIEKYTYHWKWFILPIMQGVEIQIWLCGTHCPLIHQMLIHRFGRNLEPLIYLP